MKDAEQKLIKQKLKSSKIGKPGTQPWKQGFTYISNFEYVINDDIYFIDQFHGFM